jgi:hypothetical protein
VHEGLGPTIVRRCAGFQQCQQAAVRITTDPQDRVHHQVDGKVATVQLRRHRIDEERHVVGDDLDDRVFASPAMLVEARIIDANDGCSNLPLFPQTPVGERRTEQCVRASVRNVVERHARVILAEIRSDCGGLFLAQSPLSAFANPLEQFRSVEIVGVRHGAAPARCEQFAAFCLSPSSFSFDQQ